MDSKENTKNPYPGQEEIDLRFVYRKIKQFFDSIWNTVTRFSYGVFYLIKKRWILIFLLTILGIGSGIGLFYIMRPVYVSTMVLSSNTLNNDFCNDLVNTLDLLIRDKTPKLLARQLKIDTATAKAIKELEFDNYNEELKEKYDKKDTVVLGIPFKIKAYTYDYMIFDTLQTAIVNYLENNEYALKRKAIRIENIKKLKEKLNQEIYQVDSLKFVIASNAIPRGTESGFVFGQPIDPLNMFREGINLFKEDLNLNTTLVLIDNIQVIQGFTTRIKPHRPKLSLNVAIGGGIAFFTGLLLAFYLEFRGKLAAF